MIPLLEDLLHDGAQQLDLLEQRHRQDAPVPELVELLGRLCLHLQADVKNLRNALLEVMHLLHQVSEVERLLDLCAFKQCLVHGANENQHLAPVDMRWVSDLLHACSALLILELLGEVQILLVYSLHNVRLEESLEHL